MAIQEEPKTSENEAFDDFEIIDDALAKVRVYSVTSASMTGEQRVMIEIRDTDADGQNETKILAWFTPDEADRIGDAVKAVAATARQKMEAGS